MLVFYIFNGTCMDFIALAFHFSVLASKVDTTLILKSLQERTNVLSIKYILFMSNNEI